MPPNAIQPPVLALPDKEYPSWLGNLLDKFESLVDGPGGKLDGRLSIRIGHNRSSALFVSLV